MRSNVTARMDGEHDACDATITTTVTATDRQWNPIGVQKTGIDQDTFVPDWVQLSLIELFADDVYPRAQARIALKALFDLGNAVHNRGMIAVAQQFADLDQ